MKPGSGLHVAKCRTGMSVCRTNGQSSGRQINHTGKTNSVPGYMHLVGFPDNHRGKSFVPKKPLIGKWISSLELYPNAGYCNSVCCVVNIIETVYWVD